MLLILQKLTFLMSAILGVLVAIYIKQWIVGDIDINISILILLSIDTSLAETKAGLLSRKPSLHERQFTTRIVNVGHMGLVLK